MIDLEEIYFDWLMANLDEEGVPEGVAYVSRLLHTCPFLRRVGHDLNRAADGAALRKEFLEQFDDVRFAPDDIEDLLNRDCSWLEMMVALAKDLDYLYDGGVLGRFMEMISNLRLGPLATYRPRRSRVSIEYDRGFVELVTSNVDNNRFDAFGHGGLFPLKKNNHPDQRTVEIWDQCGAYFEEKLEGVLWTSTE